MWDLFLIIIIIILAYLLFKSKKKSGKDFVDSANKYGEASIKAFQSATKTFQSSLKEKDTPSSSNSFTSSYTPEKDEILDLNYDSFLYTNIYNWFF